MLFYLYVALEVRGRGLLLTARPAAAQGRARLQLAGWRACARASGRPCARQLATQRNTTRASPLPPSLPRAQASMNMGGHTGYDHPSWLQFLITGGIGAGGRGRAGGRAGPCAQPASSWRRVGGRVQSALNPCTRATLITRLVKREASPPTTTQATRPGARRPRPT